MSQIGFIFPQSFGVKIRKMSFESPPSIEIIRPAPFPEGGVPVP